MGYGRAKAALTNAYDRGLSYKTASNSLAALVGDFLKLTGGSFIQLAGAGDTIEGVSVTKKTFDSDNQTVAKDQIAYKPKEQANTYKVPVSGTSLVFAGALVSSNTINLKVNGVAMTQETFDTNNDTTLDNIAAQLVTDFPTVIASAARSGTRTIIIETVGDASTVVLTNIVVAAGASQTTGSQVDLIGESDVGKFYDINATQFVKASTEHATSGQLRLEKYLSASLCEFSIANT